MAHKIYWSVSVEKTHSFIHKAKVKETCQKWLSILSLNPVIKILLLTEKPSWGRSSSHVLPLLDKLLNSGHQAGLSRKLSPGLSRKGRTWEKNYCVVGKENDRGKKTRWREDWEQDRGERNKQGQKQVMREKQDRDRPGGADNLTHWNPSVLTLWVQCQCCTVLVLCVSTVSVLCQYCVCAEGWIWRFHSTERHGTEARLCSSFCGHSVSFSLSISSERFSECLCL